MRLMCLDTCSQTVSVAAMEDGKLCLERWSMQKTNHSQVLLPLIAEITDELGWTQESVDCWAVVNGPGSFTGVRIGVSTVRALAHGWNKPIVAVNSLETIAAQVTEKSVCIIPMLDARRGQVYAALYERNELGLEEKLKPTACSFADMLQQPQDRECILIGDGAQANKDSAVPDNMRFAPPELQYIHAGVAAEIAWGRWQKGEMYTYRDLEPLYIREPQAVRDLQK